MSQDQKTKQGPPTKPELEDSPQDLLDLVPPIDTVLLDAEKIVGELKTPEPEMKRCPDCGGYHGPGGNRGLWMKLFQELMGK